MPSWSGLLRNSSNLQIFSFGNYSIEYIPFNLQEYMSLYLCKVLIGLIYVSFLCKVLIDLICVFLFMQSVNWFNSRVKYINKQEFGDD